ncbi:MAG: helix-turn-helix transcriptional regulator [Proteobacteria bacterium]|nr:helix-turn-helix transcriptional regulator [Pseudomonadota bacterium]
MEKFLAPKRTYIRTCRKRSGLTQRDMGFLLSGRDGNSIYRYERGKQTPTLPVALACQIVLGLPVCELFIGIHEEVEAIIHKQARVLLRRARFGKDKKTAQKIVTLKAILGTRRPAPHHLCTNYNNAQSVCSHSL